MPGPKLLTPLSNHLRIFTSVSHRHMKPCLHLHFVVCPNLFLLRLSHFSKWLLQALTSFSEKPGSQPWFLFLSSPTCNRQAVPTFSMCLQSMESFPPPQPPPSVLEDHNSLLTCWLEGYCLFPPTLLPPPSTSLTERSTHRSSPLKTLHCFLNALKIQFKILNIVDKNTVTARNWVSDCECVSVCRVGFW